MAERKPFKNSFVQSPELTRLIEKARENPVSDEQLREQRISFAYGNAMDTDSITKETVRLATQRLKLMD